MARDLSNGNLTTPTTTFPIYKAMGTITLGSHGEYSPIVAMARAISDDAEPQGGTYILRLGDDMIVTIDVEIKHDD